VTIGAAKAWSLLHIALPTYPAVEKSVWLKQNWPPAAREWYHHASQGGQFPADDQRSLRVVHRAGAADLSLGDAGLLARPGLSRSFGFIPSTRRTAPTTGGAAASPRPRRATTARRHCRRGGIACRWLRLQRPAKATRCSIPDGRPWRNPATGRTMSALGLSCAACTPGRLTFKGTEYLVDGGSAMTDIVKLNQAIGVALVLTKLDRWRFDRFALRLLGPDANDESRAASAPSSMSWRPALAPARPRREGKTARRGRGLRRSTP